MSSENALVTASSYNLPIIGRPAGDSAESVALSEDPLLNDYEPALRPFVLSGLTAIRWASQRDPALLHVPPLNDMSYPPIHPDFMRRANSLQKENAHAAYAGATVLAVASAYQQISSPEARQAAGRILYDPSLRVEVADLSMQHEIHGDRSGDIRLSAGLMGAPGEAITGPEPRYYFLNMHTHFQQSHVLKNGGWAIGKVEAGIIDHERFASIESANFHQLVRMAQLLNTLTQGEGYLVDMPQNGYNLEWRRNSG